MFPTWTDNNGQDDIIWGAGSNVGNNIWYYRVNASSHGNETVGYITHIYSYNSSGSVISLIGLGGYDLK